MNSIFAWVNFCVDKFKEFDNIIIVDSLNYAGNTNNISEIIENSNISLIPKDIVNVDFEKLFVDYKINTIINFAAQTHVDRSISDADPFLVSNIRGTFTILQIITKQKKRMIQISTDEVFGSLYDSSATEQSRFNPSSPYAATKASAELLVNSFSVTYDSDVIVTRCTNNYGPRQFPEKLIPKVIILANQNKKIPIYGNGKNIRDWIFVDDHCDAVSSVLFNGKKGESYNISANNEVDNITIVKKILAIMDKSEDLMQFVEDRPGHDFRYSLNSKKISDELGWKRNTNFDEGIRKTVQWYLDNPEILNDISSTVLDSTPWKSSN